MNGTFLPVGQNNQRLIVKSNSVKNQTVSFLIFKKSHWLGPNQF